MNFQDTRGKRRELEIISTSGDSRLAEITKTAYIEEGLALALKRHDQQLAEASFSQLPETMAPLQLAIGDRLLLTRSDEPGRNAERGSAGQVIGHARVPCALKEAFDSVKPDEHVWFDDGKIGGKVLENDGEKITIEITTPT